MKARLKQLLIRSFDDSLTQKEQNELQKGFADYPELVQEKEALSIVRHALQKQSYSFQYGFSEKIMCKIDTSQILLREKLQDYFYTRINALFRWVAPIGTIVIVVFSVIIFFSESSEPVNAITGINNLSFNDAITLSIYNYK